MWLASRPNNAQFASFNNTLPFEHSFAGYWFKWLAKSLLVKARQPETVHSSVDFLQCRLPSLSLSASAWLISKIWRLNKETLYFHRHLNKEKQGIKLLIFDAVSISSGSIIRTWQIDLCAQCLQLDGRILQTLLFTGGCQYPANIFWYGCTKELQLNPGYDKWYQTIQNELIGKSKKDYIIKKKINLIVYIYN